MIHLKKITVKDPNACVSAHVFEKGFSFKCTDVNLLVGGQGTGKSTLIDLLATNNKHCLNIDLAEHVKKDGISSYHFDTEKHNPRTRDSELYTTPSGKDIGIGQVAALTSRWKSHGEIIEWMVIDPLFTAENCVILLDEPESGLSIANQFRLIEGVNTAVKKGCQLFIATHCYPLIEAHEVISLDHKCRMPGKEYIERTLNTKKKER